MKQDEINTFIKTLAPKYETCYNRDHTELGIYEPDDLFPKALLNIKSATLERNEFDEKIPTDIESALFISHVQMLSLV